MADYQGAGLPDVERALGVMFETPPFYEFYPTIMQKYSYFGFTDKLTDEQRLSEFAEVYQQFRKFVGSKMSAVMDRQENLDSLLTYLEDQRDRSDVYPKTRVEMVRNSLKVDWIDRCRNQVTALIEEIRGGY